MNGIVHLPHFLLTRCVVHFALNTNKYQVNVHNKMLFCDIHDI